VRWWLLAGRCDALLDDLREGRGGAACGAFLQATAASLPCQGLDARAAIPRAQQLFREQAQRAPMCTQRGGFAWYQSRLSARLIQ
jgi:hypothetical protein